MNDLTNVNVFIGKNGAGKSTILDAILVASAFVKDYDNILGMKKLDYVISRRTGRGDWHSSRDMLWFSMFTEAPVDIVLNFSDDVEMPLKLFNFDHQGYVWLKIPDNIRNKLRIASIYDIYNYKEQKTYSSKDKRYGASIDREKICKILGSQNIEFLENVTLIDSELLSHPDVIEKKLWQKILAKRLDKKLVEIIKEGYEVDAEGLTYMPIGGYHCLALQLSNTTVRIDDLGDGARNAILILLITIMLKNTAVLIEEPENHQHPGGLVTLLKSLLKLAEMNKIQLFITTHSIELIKILQKVHGKLDLRIFFLERDKNGYVDVRTLESIDTELLMDLGLDPRFLYVV